MPYSREYFRLNFLFAERAAELASIPLPEALFRYTHLYRAMRMGTTPNSANPDWQAYLAGLADAEDPPGWTHAFCEERHARLPPRILENASGCFSFELWEDGRVRLHFRNAESPGVSPLCRERMPVRRAELADLFSRLRRTLPGDARVVGGSWMYHLEAYRRLFPLRFLQTARPVRTDFQFITLWGQFLDRDGRVRPRPADAFECNIRQAAQQEDLPNCFPFPVLYLEESIQVFYDHFEIPHTGGD